MGFQVGNIFVGGISITLDVIPANTRHRAGVFIVTFNHISPFCTISTANFEQVNVSWEYSRRCFIERLES